MAAQGGWRSASSWSSSCCSWPRAPGPACPRRSRRCARLIGEEIEAHIEALAAGYLEARAGRGGCRPAMDRFGQEIELFIGDVLWRRAERSEPWLRDALRESWSWSATRLRRGPRPRRGASACRADAPDTLADPGLRHAQAVQPSKSSWPGTVRPLLSSSSIVNCTPLRSWYSSSSPSRSTRASS